MKMKTRHALLALVAGFSPSPAQAQTAPPAYDDFQVTATIIPPQSSEVEVLGMDDIQFGQIELSTGETIVPAQTDHFCLNRSTPGNVLVTFDQLTDAEPGPGFRMVKAGEADQLPFAIRLIDPAGVDWPIERGVQFPTPRSAQGCTAANAANANIGHRINVTPAPIPDWMPHGLYTTTIQITIAPVG